MNYLFIACDQLRFDTLSINGNTVCETPYLDSLAKEGINFTNAYTASPLCTPARGSIFTGNYAFKHGMGTNCDMYHSLARELADPSKLLHHDMQELGYRTGYVGKWHVGTDIGPCDLGYEGMNVPGYGNCRVEKDFNDYLDANNLKYTVEKQIYLNPDEKTLCAGVWNGADESTTDWYLTNRTIDEMERIRKDGDKYFMTCQYWGPHGPHTPPIDWVGKADRNKIDAWKSFEEDLSNKPEFVSRHLKFYRQAPETWDECREIIGLYYDEMMFLDSQIGRIINYLKDTNQYDNTAIFFTCDHGDMQFSHNGLIDKGFLYQEAMKIPMIIRHPNYLNGEGSNALVHNMDILPTILEDMGKKVDRDAMSLIDVMSGKSEGRAEIYMEFHGIHFLYTQRAVVDKNNMKFIWTPGDVDELYDLNSDNEELHNLISDPKYAEILDGMVEKLKKNAVKFGDPVMDYIYKIFGEWESPSGQVDATNSKYNTK